MVMSYFSMDRTNTTSVRARRRTMMARLRTYTIKDYVSSRAIPVESMDSTEVCSYPQCQTNVSIVCCHESGMGHVCNLDGT